MRQYGSPLGYAPKLTKASPRGIMSVSDRQRECFNKRVVGGWSYAELAAHFGVSYSTVSQWVSRVKEALEDERNMADLRRAK